LGQLFCFQSLLNPLFCLILEAWRFKELGSTFMFHITQRTAKLEANNTLW
jgi:hypothetical protein